MSSPGPSEPPGPPGPPGLEGLERTPSENERFKERLIVSFVLLLFVSGVMVALRIYTKLRFVRKIGSEDICSITAYLCNIGTTICFCLAAQGVPAIPNQFANPEALKAAYKTLFGTAILNYLTLFFIKLSFCLQYLQIFPSKGMRIAIYVVIGIVIIYASVAVFMTIFLCSPVSTFWEKSFKEPGCGDFLTALYISASLNILTDLLIILLPLPGLKHLMLPTSQKIGLMAVFAVGFVVCAFSVIRIVAMVYAPIMYYPSWAGQPIALWTSIEANLALICSCLPTLRPFAVRLFKKVHGSTISKWNFTDFTGKGKTTTTNQNGSKSSNTVGSSDGSNKEFDATHLMGSKEITIHTSYQVSHAGRTQSENSRTNKIDEDLIFQR